MNICFCQYFFFSPKYLYSS